MPLRVCAAALQRPAAPPPCDAHTRLCLTPAATTALRRRLAMPRGTHRARSQRLPRPRRPAPCMLMGHEHARARCRHLDWSHRPARGLALDVRRRLPPTAPRMLMARRRHRCLVPPHACSHEHALVVDTRSCCCLHAGSRGPAPAPPHTARVRRLFLNPCTVHACSIVQAHFRRPRRHLDPPYRHGPIWSDDEMLVAELPTGRTDA
ncbi:hypothetical protein GGX14DRAFT_577024 [Mycena pura]|uniref:Uncharacterized protein n=1 Tax=Mycena pura TaxID=153505 RepID=A0AAD6UWT1_9AGAR|nr:hypothetical protein GGX14DRAFT_577024 [Mycena pura]